MEIKQSRNSNRTRFEFGEDELNYRLEDSSGSRSFSVQSTETRRDRQTIEEHNQWLRNVDVLWLILGGGLTIYHLMGDTPRPPSIWLYVGAVCYAIYWFRRTKFTIRPPTRAISS